MKDTRLPAVRLCLWVRVTMLTEDGQLYLKPCSKRAKDTGTPVQAWSACISSYQGRFWEKHRA